MERPFPLPRQGEGYLDIEAAFGTRACGENRGVRGSDGGDDGQPEPDPAVPASTLFAEALEGLQQPVDLVGGYNGPSVGYPEASPASGGASGDPHPAPGDVVADGVVQQIRREAFNELRVARHPARLKRGFDQHVS